MKKLLLVFLFVFPALTFAQISGTKIISNANADSNFKTLRAAISHINSVGVNGPVTLLLDENQATTDLASLITINAFSGSSPTNTLTIKPNVGKTITITASNTLNNNAVTAVLNINGGDNIIIDGSNVDGGTSRDLTFINSDSIDSANRSAIWLSSLSSNGVNNITISNVKIKMNVRNQASKRLCGIFSGGIITNSNLVNPAAAQNDGLLVENNEFINLRQGIVIQGGIGSGLNSKNILISSNVFGNINDVEKLSSAISVSDVNIVNILDNSIDGLLKAEDEGENVLSGIKVQNGTNYNIKRNFINNLITKYDQAGRGILISGEHSNGCISENKISDVSRSVQGGNLLSGIEIAITNPNSNSNLTLANNFISNISNIGYGEYSTGAYGIYITSGKDIKIFNNTISMNASFVGISAAIYFNNGSAFDVRNNIFSNTNATIGLKRFAIFSAVPSSSFTNINYNNYFAPRIGSLNGTEYVTFSGWKTAISSGAGNNGKDENSKNINPTFVSPTDLHLQSVTGNAALDNTGIQIPIISTDIDGQIRSTTTPDIGADEFSAVPIIPVLNTSTAALAVFTTCAQTASTSQNFTISGANLNANIVVTASAGFEVSKDDTSFSTSISFTPISASVASTTVYVRMAATASSPASGTIAITSTGATTVNKSVSGAIGGTTTWTGISWDNGTPTSSSTAIIAADYINQSSDIVACSLTIINNAQVIIKTGYNVNINGALTVETGSSFTLSNNSNLVQKKNISNTGAITILRDSNPLKRLDYILWSSPTSDQELYAFSNKTLANRFYVYNPATDLYNTFNGFNITGLNANNVNGTDINHAKFAMATGYLIRMPWNHPESATIWTGQFTGIPNNGTKTAVVTANSYNAIGNPYPSTIDLVKFAADNNANIDKTLYFWRKTNNTNSPSYSTYNALTNTFVNNNEAYSVNPNGILQVAQGFIVKTLPGATEVNFNNMQRISNNTNQFFKSSSNSTTEAHRIWFNLTGPNNSFSQTVVGYFSNSSLEVDNTDSELFSDGPIGIFSKVGNQNLAIQGRPVPFESTDAVSISYKANVAGTYNISIDHVDGLFDGSQDIFLRDTQLAIDQNLNTGTYSFTTEPGTFDNRFVVVYQSVLGTTNPTFNSNAILVAKSNNVISINAGTYTIKAVEIYDLLGSKIYTTSNVENSTTSITALNISNQVILVKVFTDNGTVTKKVQF